MSHSFLCYSKYSAAVSPELWDWSSLGLPLVPHDKRGRQWAVPLVCYTACSQLNTGLTRAQYSSKPLWGRERERERQRDTGQQRHRQGDHRNTNPPPNPQLCRERRPTKAFFAFSLKEKKVTIRRARSFT